MSQYQALERIKIRFEDFCDLNVDIFSKMINLRRAKLNVQFDIEIEAYNKNGFVLEEYKNKFEQTKHETNVKLIFYLNEYDSSD